MCGIVLIPCVILLCGVLLACGVVLICAVVLMCNVVLGSQTKQKQTNFISIQTVTDHIYIL